MKATPLGLGDLLHSRQPFEIPKYQRSYAWEREQIDEFVEDLLACFRARIARQAHHHFFGGVVSIEEPIGGTLAGRRYDVVDGQQRLATFTIALSLLGKAYHNAAREAKKAKDDATQRLAESLGTNLYRDFIEYNEVVDGKPAELLRVVLSKADKEFFDALVRKSVPLPTPSRDSHKRLKTANSVIDRELIGEVVKPGKTAAEKVERLRRLQEVILEDCQIIHLVTSSQSEAYKLFQVLNDRGVSLSEGDLLRSSTLEVLESFPVLQQSVEKSWDDILSGEPIEIEQFLRAYYDSKQGERATKRDLFGDFSGKFRFRSESVSDPAEHTQQIVETIAEMRGEIAVFRNLRDAEWPYSEDRSQGVTAWERARLKILLGSLKHTLALPLLLAARQLSESKFASLVCFLERFAFRYITVCKAHPGALREVYSKQAPLIRKDPAQYDLSILQSALRTLAEERAPDPLFATSLSERLTYRNGVVPALRYFLVTIEQHGAWLEKGATGTPIADKTILHDIPEVQIEHIYPQNAVEKVDALEPLKHDLGNLTFWGGADNQAASNGTFAEKLTYYQRSNIAMNRALGQLENWTATALEQREKELIASALKVFAVS